MRLLHFRANLFGRRHAGRSEGRMAEPRNGRREGARGSADRRGDSRAHERQYLPLRGLSKHRRRHSGCRGGRRAMRSFTYERVTDPRAAIVAVSRAGAKFISGGTNLIDLMRLEIEQPTHLVDISRLPFKTIDELPGGGLRIGAQVGNSDAA